MTRFRSLFISAALAASLGAQTPFLPNPFSMNQEVQVLRGFEIDAPRAGTVEQSLSGTFTWTSPSGEVLATAEPATVSPLTTADGYAVTIKDGNGAKIGVFRKIAGTRWLLIKVYHYVIEDAQETVLGTSENSYLNTAALDIAFKRAQGDSGVIAELSHTYRYAGFWDTWTLEMPDPSVIDPRILVMIGPIKSWEVYIDQLGY